MCVYVYEYEDVYVDVYFYMYMSFQHVTPMIRGIGNVLFSQLSNIYGQDQVVTFGEPLVHVRTLFIPPSLLLSISRRRVCIQNVSVCAGNTSTCLKDVDVLPGHTEMF